MVVHLTTDTIFQELKLNFFSCRRILHQLHSRLLFFLSLMLVIMIISKNITFRGCSLQNILQCIFADMHTIPIKCKILYHQSSKTNPDHFDHKFIEHIHIPFERTQLNHPLQPAISTSSTALWICFFIVYCWYWAYFWSIESRFHIFLWVCMLDLRGQSLFLSQIVLDLFVEHQVVVVFWDQTLDLSLLSMFELEEGEGFTESGCVECFEFAWFESGVEFSYGVISEFVVEREVPT